VVRISPSGRISVYTGAAAMGQGLKTALAQICASELGVPPADVLVISGDTAVVPVGLGGFASRQTVTAGSSVLLASRAVAQKARKLASHVLEVAEGDLELADGRFRVVGAPQLGVPLGELARILAPGGAPAWHGAGITGGREPAPTRLPMPMPAMPPRSRWTQRRRGAHFALRAARPGTCQSDDRRRPVHGGIAHGIGNALLE
jgi:carbon-monoxide dehydrogenase large subunit